MSINHIKHPGELISEYLANNNMTQKELALRTGVTEKHINTLINGHKNITNSFAQKLGYVFKDTKFWIERQQEYDNEILLQKQEAGVTDEEEQIANELHDIVDYWVNLGVFDNHNNNIELIVDIRKKLKVSNLTYIPEIVKIGAFRTQVSNNSQINPYVLYAWIRTCEMIANKKDIEKRLDIELLRSRLEEIKAYMLVNKVSQGIVGLQELFAECGIIFNVVKNFKGAPVQGFIMPNEKGQLVLCLTIRRKRADTFWFTLFHEIGHILNDDYNNKFVDFDRVDSEREFKADTFAKNILINEEHYNKFINEHEEFSRLDIEKFAKNEKIKPFIVVGRLQKDELIEWGDHLDMIDYYEWVS